MKRLEQTIDVILEFFNADGDLIGEERTVTDIVAHNGMSVLSYRRIPVGEVLQVRTADRQFESPAVVKGVRLGNDNINRLILEFTGSDWEQKWVYAAQFDTGSLYINEFLDSAKEVSMLLQIVITDINQGQEPDQVFLAELQTGVDTLRQLLFRIRQA
ncbi:MAG: hypothetical protein AB1489_30305 [Acidobacteriota bacterium]